LSTLTSNAHAGYASLDAGGMIGRHPAVRDQLLIILDGQAQVSGDDNREVQIGPGQAALWMAGELHTTVAKTAVKALLLEADGPAQAWKAVFDPQTG
jgi:mannose-6-phosphate isomerase-like protein (cupin superfamily)